ncbi:flagellar hook-length control protein FliK [Neptunicella marina]|uniref:Flagellar hook-length control protein FliK n=1 Tax=Neptunicella marina TaxID=2125989 RepID=A0A8J6LW30_9ALTE|nr:flagellar hook-length control protein FliK [Neptunicella marina]MBC3764994.1 flagellar hook-length control protein FliK [Neptunicella marina]
MMQQVAALPTEVAAPAKKSVASQTSNEKNQQQFSSVFEQHQQNMRDDKAHSSNAEQERKVESSQAHSDTKSKPQSEDDKIKNTSNHDADEAEQAAKDEQVDASSQDKPNKDEPSEINETAKNNKDNDKQQQTEDAKNDKQQQDVVGDVINEQTQDEGDSESDSLVLTEAQIKQNWMALLERLTGSQNHKSQNETNQTEEAGDTDQVSDLLQMLYDKLDIDTSDGNKVSEPEADEADVSPDILARLQVLLDKLTQVLDAESQSDTNTSQVETTPVGEESNRSQLTDLIALLNQYKQSVNNDSEQPVETQASNSSDTAESSQGTDELLASVNPILEWLATLDTNSDITEQIKQNAHELTSDLKAFLAMPKEKMNKLLTQLTQQTMPQASDDTKQAFIQSLQSAVDDMNKQLENGRVPAIDLQAMLGKVVNDLSKSDSTVSNDPARQGLKQIMELAKLTSANQDSSAVQPVVMDKPGEHHEGFSTDAHKTLVSPQSQVDKTATNLQKMEGLKQLVDKVQVMVNQRNMVADIRIDPPDMGTMQIRLHIANEQASVSFVVQNQHARDALEQSTPRLREMLSERGIELGQSNVRQENQQGRGAQSDGGQTSGGGQFAELDSNDNLDEPEVSQTLNVVNGAVNGIDYFV